MIIKNNFNSKSTEPLNDYQSISKGRDTLGNLDEDEGIRENLNNQVIKDVIKKDSEYENDDEKDQDKWSFFR